MNKLSLSQILPYNCDNRVHFLLTLVKLLQEENECLRSVLSEWEDQDKSCFVQYNRAEVFRAAIECLEHKL